MIDNEDISSCRMGSDFILPFIGFVEITCKTSEFYILLPRVENYPDFVSLSGFRITVSAAGRGPAHAPAGSADLGGRGRRRPPHSPEGALTVMQ